MGKASKWIRSLLTGKKEKGKQECNIEAYYTVSTASPKTPIANLNNTHKEKRKWSFRRSVVTKDINSIASIASPKTPPLQVTLKHSIATKPSEVEEAAAIKIQSIFRSHLARKALCALKGLVKLQALVRGCLVRKQAAKMFRCMQALLTVQARSQAHRIQAVGATKKPSQKQSIQNRSSSHNEIDRGMDKDIKTVEVDIGELRESSPKNRTNYSNHNHVERLDHRYLSAFAGTSPRTFSGYFDKYTSSVEQNSPQYYSSMAKPDSMANDFSFFPNYMANTQSFRAKARSHSAPKQRPESYERQLSRRKAPAPIEGRNVPRAIRMQRSTSHVGSIANGHWFPWSMKLDRSTASLKDSECSSTSTVLTDINYSRSLVGYEVRNH